MSRATIVLSLVVASVSLTTAGAQAPQDAHEMHRLHNDPMAYIEALEDPARDAYQKPHEVMQALDVKAGEIVADEARRPGGDDRLPEARPAGGATRGHEDRAGGSRRADADARLPSVREHTFLPYQYFPVFGL
jgi:hypothetical protein